MPTFPEERGQQEESLCVSLLEIWPGNSGVIGGEEDGMTPRCATETRCDHYAETLYKQKLKGLSF